MKKVLFATLFASFSLGMSAQGFLYVPLDANTGCPMTPTIPSVPSNSYFPYVPLDINTGRPMVPATPSAPSGGTQQTPQVSVVQGYIAEQGKLVHQKLRVCGNIGPFPGPYVLGVYRSDVEQWYETKVQAQKVSTADAQIIKDRFEWSAVTVFGTVYFNY